MSRIYVGNLSRETTESSLREILTRDGRTVTWITIKKDATSGTPRGFAFADMGSPEEAAAAIASLHGTQMDGKTIKVNGAKEQNVRTRDRDSGGYGGGGGGYGGGGGGFGGRGRR